jgi:hypothetical protein
VNLAFAAMFWLLLRRKGGYSPATRYFLVLAMAANLFTGTGYFLFSGFTNFGHWAAVIHALEPHWLWRVGLVVIGAASYYASMMVVGAELNRFRNENQSSRRLRSLSWSPYFTDGILAAVAGLPNPAGLFYVVASALPSILGANAGLLSLPSMRRWSPTQDGPIGLSRRSVSWIAAGALGALVFIFALGRGITWSR